MIEVQNVCKSFGSLCALDNVSLTAKPGELITLLGPNGAGKTTLIRIICGYLFPDSGTVKIDGKTPDENFAEYVKKIGYIPENTPLYEEMKAGEYLEFAAAAHRMPQAEIRHRIAGLAEQMEIAAVLEQKIATLSKGYKKRVGIAAAMIHCPDILVLDEPTEGLDPNQKQIVRRLLKEYAAHKLVLVSTHLLEEAEAIATRIWVIAKGKVAGDATVAELKAMAKDSRLSSAFYNITQSKQEEE